MAQVSSRTFRHFLNQIYLNIKKKYYLYHSNGKEAKIIKKKKKNIKILFYMATIMLLFIPIKMSLFI